MSCASSDQVDVFPRISDSIVRSDDDDENMANNAQTTLGLAFGNIMDRENLLEAMVGTQAYKDYIHSESKMIRTDIAFGVE